MRKKKVPSMTYLPGMLIMLYITSCAPAYVPNVINTPLCSNPGEFQASVNGGLAGFDPQISYALTDNIAIMLNGSFASRTSDSTDNFHKHQFVEMGLGYYQKFGTSGRFETYGGAGFGQLRAEYDNELWMTRSNVNSRRFFIQPAIGVSTDFFDGGLAARFVYLYLIQESKSNTGVFVEPAITAKVGPKHVKAVFQIGLSIPVNSGSLEFNYQPFLFSVGLQTTLGRRYE
ncbi:MAG: hypothetical protein JW723_11260 [Bacteroidales bacterium]|nr:hypothetical protein [Bacteroidales bacterium]